MYRFDLHAAQIQGVRPRQEDSWGSHNVGGILCAALADGFGGHRCGDIAAQLTIDQVLDELQSAISDDPRRPPAVNLCAAARKAHEAVNRCRLTDPECARMAATLIAVCILLAGDGIETLSRPAITCLLRQAADARSAIESLLAAIEAQASPRQDNATMVALFVGGEDA